MFINKHMFICIVLLLPLNYAFSEPITEMAVSSSYICIPWNKGYYNNKEPYISMGVGYNIAGNNNDQ